MANSRWIVLYSKFRLPIQVNKEDYEGNRENCKTVVFKIRRDDPWREIRKDFGRGWGRLGFGGWRKTHFQEK